MDFRDICRTHLKVDEGVRPKPYKDSEGILTVGVGRNLDDVGLRPDEIDYLLNNDLRVSELDVRSLLPRFDDLSENRKAALLNMAFNLGKSRLAGFKNMLAAVQAGEFDRAADEMLSSKWAGQVKGRAQRLAQMMREG